MNRHALLTLLTEQDSSYLNELLHPKGPEADATIRRHSSFNNERTDYLHLDHGPSGARSVLHYRDLFDGSAPCCPVSG